MKTFETKTGNVKKHLQKKGSITSWDAIIKYQATRLSAIIFNLKNHHGMLIESVRQEKDGVYFVKYVYKGLKPYSHV
jgi:hypothetical protein